MKNGENKLNINKFIEKEEINKTKNVSNIEIKINSKKVYKNYEIYSITIKNNTSNTIKIADENNSKDICLLDKNNVEYASFLEEISISDLSLRAGESKNVNIKFNKIYDLYRVIEKIKFNNIDLGLQEYTDEASNEKINVTIEI